MNIDERLNLLKRRCLEDKHIWKMWNANTVVDTLTFEPTGAQRLICYLNGEPLYRGCIICGLQQKQEKDWENI